MFEFDEFEMIEFDETKEFHFHLQSEIDVEVTLYSLLDELCNHEITKREAKEFILKLFEDRKKVKGEKNA